MKNDDAKLEENVEKRFRQKERRKRKRMKVTGKHVFTLQRLMDAPGKKSRP